MLGRWIHRPSPSPWLKLSESLHQASYRQSSTHASGCILRGVDLGPTHEDGHQTVRIRKDEVAKELPLPPLLDPVILDQRSRWEQPKEQPRIADFTPFQKKLWANPFAHALASPVRQCRATLISLPLAFFTSLHARPHPTTNDPWLLPVSLTTDTKQLGSPLRFIGRQAAVAQLGRKKAWERALYARMTEKLAGHNLKKMVWREDMPEFILEMMRKRLVKKLSWSFGWTGRLTPVASPRTDDIVNVDHVSTILIFRSLRTRADDAQQRLEDIQMALEKWSSYFAKNFKTRLDPHASPNVTHTSPHWYTEPVVPRLQPRSQFPELEFKTTTWRGQTVALYSLTDLLGEEKARALIEGSRYSGESCVVLKRSRHNVPVEILLMQLQAYVAQPGP